MGGGREMMERKGNLRAQASPGQRDQADDVLPGHQSLCKKKTSGWFGVGDGECGKPKKKETGRQSGGKRKPNQREQTDGNFGCDGETQGSYLTKLKNLKGKNRGYNRRGHGEQQTKKNIENPSSATCPYSKKELSTISSHKAKNFQKNIFQDLQESQKKTQKFPLDDHSNRGITRNASSTHEWRWNVWDML